MKMMQNLLNNEKIKSCLIYIKTETETTDLFRSHRTIPKKNNEDGIKLRKKN